MKKLNQIWYLPFFLGLFLGVQTTLIGQEEEKCSATISPELYESYRNQSTAVRAHSFNRAVPGIIDIPMTINVIRDESETGGNWNLNDQSIQILLDDWSDVFDEILDFEFVICSDINYLTSNVIANNPNSSILPHNTSSINVYVFDTNSNSAASFPCGAIINPSFPCDEFNSLTVTIGSTNALTNQTTMIHELGHHFGLLHTHEPGRTYNSPPATNQDDYPYPTGNPNYYIGRELVIREDEPPFSSLDFLIANCETGGDLICDTPPDCRVNSENQYPGCAINYNLCEHSGSYVDYNGQSINNPSEGNVVLNYMSYHSSCSNEFTPEQIARMDFYYTTERVNQYALDKCGNLNDEVLVWGTAPPLENVMIDLSNTESGHSTREITNADGSFSGVLREPGVKANVKKIGSTDYFEYTREEWGAGITVFDLVKIKRHILNVSNFSSGYAHIAADVNNSGSVTTLDMLHLRKFLLQISDNFPNQDSPWRFVPEYIPNIYPSEFNIAPFNMSVLGISTPNSAPYLEADWEYQITDGNNGNSGFDAIKIGDVNNSFANITPQIGDPVFLTIDQEVLGTKANYKFQVEGFNNIIGYQMEINFDKTTHTYLKGVEKDLQGIKGDFFGTTNVSKGKIPTLWYDDIAAEPFSLPSFGEIFELEFEGAGNFQNATISLALESNDDNRLRKEQRNTLKNFAYDKDGVIHPIILKEKKSSQIYSIKCYPNPIEKDLNIEIDLNKEDVVNIEIFNSLGQLIYSNKKFLFAGVSTIKLQDLPKGFLLVKVSNQSNSRIEKVLSH